MQTTRGRERTRQKLVSRPNSKFSISARISACFRGPPDPIRRLRHFQNARASFWNVYYKILLPPVYTHTHIHMYIHKRLFYADVTRAALLHEILREGTMRFTSAPYVAAQRFLSFVSLSQWLFSLPT